MGIGIDTIRLSWEHTDRVIRPPSSWGEWSEEYRPPALRVGADGAQSERVAQWWYVDGQKGWRVCSREDGSGWVEGSLPRLISSEHHNRSPTPAAGASAVVRCLLRDIGIHDPLRDLAHVRLRRLDCAGDWSGPVAPWRAAFLASTWPGSRSLPQADLWSVTIGRHGHNQVVLYDKGVEQGLAPETHGRCEVRSHSFQDQGNFAWNDLAWAADHWSHQVARVGGSSPVAPTGSAYADALIYCLNAEPHLRPGVEVILRSLGSRSSLTRFRRLVRARAARRGELGADLVDLVRCQAA